MSASQTLHQHFDVEADDIVDAFEETAAGELAVHLSIDRRLEIPIELIKRLEPGQPAASSAEAPLIPTLPLDFERAREEASIVETLRAA